MSERLPGLGLGLDLLHTPSEPRPSSVAVLYRRAGAGVEVFWVKRGKQLAFAGGFYAFPGGKLDAADSDVPVRGAAGEEAALRSAAARELFEEAGRPGGGGRGGAPAREGERAAARRCWRGSRGWGELLTAEGLSHGE
ncbi:NUDIX domain-containing protein, partial [Pyxidicoccus sp. 3LG]